MFESDIFPKRPLKQRLQSVIGLGGLMLLFLLSPIIFMYYLFPHTPVYFSTPSSSKSISNNLLPKPPSEFNFDIPVLTYHYIRTVENPQQDQLGFRLSVTPQDFETQAKYLVDNGYRTLTPDEIIEALKSKQPLPKKSVVLTFDDGYEDFYTQAFPILMKYDLQATLYVVPGFVSDKLGRYITWDQLKEVDESGLVTIGAHTMHHVNLPTSTKAQDEILQSKKTLELFLGHSITTFAYPGGQWNTTIAQYVKNAGFTHAFTTEIGTDMYLSQKYSLPRVRVSGGLAIKDFPLKLKSIHRAKAEG